ncbi:F-box/FBD/LRR-repeat protein At4g26340-like [Vicia villosa]|uniref:F-box/FBD/LRR-repeat protein At4g26340-like n=1 Tax=Vicia villosa TaxID=3911 RepID=UPI00273B2548|nr:F-box/FBD/LRR-repeat protein At4g26340-like [Vicia villosa]
MDRIGALPDEILTHILSFIPTTQAIATSILSKRWIHLWRHVPLLRLSDTKLKNLADNHRFNEFVYTLLLSREAAGNHSINTFFLDIEYFYAKLAFRPSNPNITNWIDYAVDCDVQHLDLYLDVLRDDDKHLKFPRLPVNVFNCKTLVSLKLHWFHVEECFSVEFVDFPSLKVLHLKEIYFDEYEEFVLLLAGCPVLEDLHVCDVNFGCLKILLEFDNVFKSSCLRSLTRAYVRGCCCDFWLKALSNLKFLSIDFLKGDRHDIFPTFHNLTHLELNYDWYRVVEVLQHCPKLQKLDFHQNLASRSDECFIENWADLEFVPKCLSLNLTTCTLWGFLRTTLQGELMVARYILKNAAVLQTMKIWCIGEQSLELEINLSSCPRASATCQLSFN